MEIIIVLGLLIALAVAAPRWGHDSRTGLRSEEQNLASSGLSWSK
jgi:hypothetical protein